ncbi:Protein EFFECTOR OF TRANSCRIPTION 2 [Rhynchospora pubera]|uniref:Protein EFFECTOR OF TRANSCRIPTION 2 n=1 Tax=Rhynchospora pubera TaxID=906938 RepID=A0AAV8ET47_9POAL|nr:Protein EFFECTOR OF TRANSCRIPTION 2 [Rhynchospora pubera]
MEKKIIRRVKREECSRTKHDAFFSPWKILVGPSDWDDHWLGKEGARRYMIHNLPENFPGLYELGIVKPGTNICATTRSDDLKDVVVVYLGQADNVRTRLQHYGRTGSHLECGKVDNVGKGQNVQVKEEPGLFREVFALGFSIAYRCVPMKSKLEAEKREAELLNYFDYAWNQIYNGSCRREEILSKLDKKLSTSQRSSSILQKIQKLKKILFYEKQVGVRIDNSVLFDEYMIPQVRKVGTSRPQVIEPGTEISHTTMPIENTCGIALGDGGVCAKIPIKGRKRCEDHKGRRILETRKEKLLNNNGQGCEIEQAWLTVCGVTEIDGSICKNPPAAGRKRCEVHKGRRKTNKEILLPIS